MPGGRYLQKSSKMKTSISSPTTTSGDFKGGLRVLEHPPRDCIELLIMFT